MGLITSNSDSDVNWERKNNALENYIVSQTDYETVSDLGKIKDKIKKHEQRINQGKILREFFDVLNNDKPVCSLEKNDDKYVQIKLHTADNGFHTYVIYIFDFKNEKETKKEVTYSKGPDVEDLLEDSFLDVKEEVVKVIS